MVNDVTPTVPAIGACLQCNQVFLVTDTHSSCLYCGKAPSLTLPFGLGHYIDAAVQATVDTESQEPAKPILIGVTCSHCQQTIHLAITDTEIAVVPPPPAPPAEEAVAEVPAPSAAAPPPDEPELAPAMAQDVFGHPIEGPPEGGYGDAGLTTEHGLEPIDLPPKLAPPAAPEEPPG
jgi:hypothetical protein